MYVSLNEIEAQVRRAARGAGLSWGQAEEAGKAARKLIVSGLDVLPAFADLLDSHADSGAVASTIVSNNGVWRGGSGPLSPLVLGPVIVDHARAICDGRVVVAGPVIRPVLLVPFVATAARIGGRRIALRWPGGCWVVGPDAAQAGDLDELFRLSAARDVTCGPADVRPTGRPIGSAGATYVPLDLWARFDRLACLTYVPASERSRETGAGAGAIDND